MTTESQKLALLEWAGWKKFTDTNHEYSGSHAIVTGYRRKDDSFRSGYEWRDMWNLPNLDSLDVLAEFEAKLAGHSGERSRYGHILFDLLGCGGDSIHGRSYCKLATAKPEQRLEALVRALGLWREGGVKLTRAEFLALPVEKQREILEMQCTPEIIHHYEVTCPECGLYYGGHATGGQDICDCHTPPKD
jgi:hypothetical protein